MASSDIFHNYDRSIDRGEDRPLSGPRLAKYDDLSPETAERIRSVVQSFSDRKRDLEAWHSPAARFFNRVFDGLRYTVVGPLPDNNTFAVIVQTEGYPRVVKFSFQEAVGLSGGWGSYGSDLMQRIQRIVFGCTYADQCTPGEDCACEGQL